jgi:hypothetical protein
VGSEASVLCSGLGFKSSSKRDALFGPADFHLQVEQLAAPGCGWFPEVLCARRLEAFCSQFFGARSGLGKPLSKVTGNERAVHSRLGD